MPTILRLILVLILTKNVLAKTTGTVGGPVAKRGQFPFFAQLIIQYPTNETANQSDLCGASLILPKWLLTAGHCFSHLEHETTPNWYNVTVIIGTNLRSDPWGHTNTINRIISHSRYSEERVPGSVIQIYNDVAVLELAKPCPINQYIQLAYLPLPAAVNQQWTTRCKTGTVVGLGLKGPTVEPTENDYHDFVLYDTIESKKCPQTSIIKELPLKFPTKFFTELKWLRGHAILKNAGGPFVCYFSKIPVVYGLVSKGLASRMINVTLITFFEEVDKQMAFILRVIPEAASRIIEMDMLPQIEEDYDAIQRIENDEDGATIGSVATFNAIKLVW